MSFKIIVDSFCDLTQMCIRDSRQGVRDVIVRAEAILTELEDKTGIIRRFHRMQEQFGQMETAVDAIAQRNEAHWQDDELESLCGQLKGVLAQLKQE